MWYIDRIYDGVILIYIVVADQLYIHLIIRIWNIDHKYAHSARRMNGMLIVMLPDQGVMIEHNDYIYH